MNSPSFQTPKCKQQADKAESRRTCLLVLGMHRSGTSAITRVLSIAGAKLPATLLGAGRGNDVGHWESSALLAYNDRLLGKLGSDWHDWRLLEIGRLSLERRRDIKIEIADLLACEYGNAPLFVVKDPRICRFAPLFIEALEDAGIGVRIVHMVRNPLEVAESLEKRNGLERADALLQWLRHALDSEAATRTRIRVVVNYASLLQDWRGVFESLTETLQVAWPYTIDDIAPQIAGFLDGAWRHHVHTTEDVLLDPAIREWVGEAFSALLVLEHNPGSNAALLVLETIRREFDHAAPVLHRLQAAAKLAWEKQLIVIKQDFDKRLADGKAEGSKLVSNARAEGEQKLADSRSETAKAHAEIERCLAALSGREREVCALKVAVEDAETRTRHAEQAQEKRNQRIAELDAALAQRSAEGEQYTTMLAERDRELAGLKSALSNQEGQVARLKRAIVEREAHIAALYGSTSWRVTAPLRFVRRFTRVLASALHAASSRAARAIYRGLPLPLPAKMTFKSALFGAAPLLFCRTRAYQDWQTWRLMMLTEEDSPKSEQARAVSIEAQFDGERDYAALFATGFPDLTSDPRVSIIIAAHNKLDYTVRCLDSVRKNTSGCFEVIVVDDCSSDPTPTTLTRIANLRLMRNEKNLGFLNSCNAGAGLARGEFILFLNNDTEVTAGWLDPMLALADRDERVAVVGSKLVYPDGSLQEAGCIYWQDARGTNYGRGDDNPNRPAYNYVREVDKCSGASLMVRKSLFDRAGGFDKRFAPAYKEDADLCFKMRQLGYKVMYQPKSVVVHYEGVSCGSDTASGIKKYQERNRPKFLEKWGAVLRTQHLPNNRKNILIARERPHAKKIALIVDDKVPEPDKHAGGLGMFHYTELFLELGYKVIFVPDNRRCLEPYTSDLQQLGVEVLYGDFNFDDMLAHNAPRIEVAWLSRPEQANKYIDSIRSKTDAKILYCGRDLHFLRNRRRAELEQNRDLLELSERMKAIEASVFERADAVLTFSDYEQDLIKEIVAAASVKVIAPYVFDAIKRRGEIEHRTDVLFVGGFKHRPNVDAALWFANDCWPEIRRQIPDAKFVIVGSDPPREIADLQGEDIIVAGHVPDLGPYFDRAIASVAPLRYGAGVKGKIVASMHHRCPAVSTTVGAEGMNLTDGIDVLVADTPRDFARHLAVLARDRRVRERIASAGANYVRQRYSRERVLSAFAAILTEVGLELPLRAKPIVGATA